MIAQFRQHLRSLHGTRPIIVLAVDGIPYDLACRVWPNATVARARSVFPTTSSTAWTTSLTGESVDSHGIPGVVFREGGELIDVYRYQGPLGDPPAGNIFSDAATNGYEPVAVLGDLEDTNCTWRDQLVHGATPIAGHRLFSQGMPEVGALEAAIDPTSGFTWCFVDVDRRIHHHGYDAEVIAFLEDIDALARKWSRDAIVIAHSDHGLVPTRQDPRVADAIARTGCEMGGAGRTRWLYVESRQQILLQQELLQRTLPASVRVRPADELFAPGSLARRRVGDLVLIAEGEDFLCAEDYRYEHGSLTEGEIDVAVARWG